ncbi:phosphoenolpyruvate synthase [Luteolibacter marinus]|uniref:phosphoenolpyruvate synthase n=1 Tax=Luteolibacter marinus TaxID=2776705 RepID=UPI001865CD49|nr:phosphoenolpyruvate synthase [Luteolibacter marinus]
MIASTSRALVRWLEDLGNNDVAIAGGKNASLGEMIRTLAGEGIRVPGGFAVTADGYRAFLDHNKLVPRIRDLLQRRGKGEAGTEKAIRQLILDAAYPPALEDEITSAYAELCRREQTDDVGVAVRSSATAEDLPDASFAGQHESFLGVAGIDGLLAACRRCFASLFTERAVSYRDLKGFDHMAIALSVGVQKMVRSDLGDGASGVMFSIDTETGFPGVILISAAFGLGEAVVQGTVTPDEYRVFKPLLDDATKRPILEKVLGPKEIKMVFGDEGGRLRTLDTPSEQRGRFVLDDDRILQLARWAKRLEEHYGRPMDMEWAVDGASGELFMLQARPETVQSRAAGGLFKSYRLKPGGHRVEVIAEGLAVGGTIARGRVRRLKDAASAGAFQPGEILLAEATNPDWVPVMKKAAAIVTDHGGRSSHAAIVSRELGVPAVVGTGNATRIIASGNEVTVSCAAGEKGLVYNGLLDFEEEEIDLGTLPAVETPIMLNIATPEAAYRWWRLPSQGIGLARMEFIIGSLIRVHPMALLRPDKVTDPETRRHIGELTARYRDKAAYFTDSLARGLARIAASCHPRPVVVRTSDFKTNEYADLLGGDLFEPQEENPMLGWRGASRYYHPDYRDAFALECKAIKQAREVIGLDNIIVMIPFCRTPGEADRVLGVMAENGLRRGENGLQVYVMAEIPSNIILASEFADRFDGFSIGSNDLTQLILGVDRDSEVLAKLFDERNEAVKTAIRELIAAAHAKGRKVGICGQGPSDHPDFAEFLVGLGIDSISLNPDSVVKVTRHLASIPGA